MYIHYFSIFLYLSIIINSYYINAVKIRKVHVSYPVELLAPIVSEHFEGHVSQNKLTCFSNRDFKPPTYLNTLLCMLNYFGSESIDCTSIWGSRSVVIEVNGSVEFLKVSKLPRESNIYSDSNDLHAIRWLSLNSVSSHHQHHQHHSEHLKDIKQIPCEPVYLCARSSDWTGIDSTFNINFRPGYIRFKDRDLIFSKSLMHLMLVFFVSSAWLLPYIAAFIIATISYKYAITYLILITMFSLSVVCLTPFMLTKRNRHFARHYIKYFFTRIHAEETREIIQKRIIVFQAVYFSSVMVCIGTAASHILYSYCGVDRTSKNVLIKACVGMAASWLTFSLCRSFERFCRDWSWVILCIGLAQLLDKHLNPAARDEVFVVILMISFITKASLSRLLKNYDWIKIAYFPYSQLKVLSSSQSLISMLQQALKSRKLPVFKDIIAVTSVRDTMISSASNNNIAGHMVANNSIHSNRISFSSIKNDDGSRSYSSPRTRSSTMQASSSSDADMSSSTLKLDPVNVMKIMHDSEEVCAYDDVGYSIDEFNGLNLMDDKHDTSLPHDNDDDEVDEEVSTIEDILDEVINDQDVDDDVFTQPSHHQLDHHIHISSDNEANEDLMTKIPFQPSTSSFKIQPISCMRLPAFTMDDHVIRNLPFPSLCPNIDRLLMTALDHMNIFHTFIILPPPSFHIMSCLDIKFRSFIICKHFHKIMLHDKDIIHHIINQALTRNQSSAIIPSYEVEYRSIGAVFSITVRVAYDEDATLTSQCYHRIKQSLYQVYKHYFVDANTSIDVVRDDIISYDVHITPSSYHGIIPAVTAEYEASEQLMQIICPNINDEIQASIMMEHLQHMLACQDVSSIMHGVLTSLVYALGIRLVEIPDMSSSSIDIAIQSLSPIATSHDMDTSFDLDDRLVREVDREGMGSAEENDMPIDMSLLDEIRDIDAKSSISSHDSQSAASSHLGIRFIWQLRMPVIKGVQSTDHIHHPSIQVLAEDPYLLSKLVASVVLAYRVAELIDIHA